VEQNEIAPKWVPTRGWLPDSRRSNLRLSANPLSHAGNPEPPHASPVDPFHAGSICNFAASPTAAILNGPGSIR
jgi:hypothetical protein